QRQPPNNTARNGPCRAVLTPGAAGRPYLAAVARGSAFSVRHCPLNVRSLSPAENDVPGVSVTFRPGFSTAWACWGEDPAHSSRLGNVLTESQGESPPWIHRTQLSARAGEAVASSRARVTRIRRRMGKSPPLPMVPNLEFSATWPGGGGPPGIPGSGG